MERREFLKGLLATTAIAAVPVIVSEALPQATSLITFDEYCVRILEPMFERMSQQVNHTIIYGNPEWQPVQFTGFSLLENCIDAT